MRSISTRMQAAASVLSDSWGCKIDLVNLSSQPLRQA